jgi:predicted N-formylglutamate amidohydrolase
MLLHQGGASAGATEPPAAASGAAAFELIPGDPATGFLILADHATNRIPAEYASLGLAPTELARHIAYDIGVEAMTRHLARLTGAPAVLSLFSRLLIDPNRGDDDPTLIMRLSDGAVVPGNARIDSSERERRIARFWRPYDEAVAAQVAAGSVDGRGPILVSLHSFTPVWRGLPRPWHCGILWDADPRLARPLIERLAAEPGLVVGDNEPYDGALAGDTLYRHATRRGLANAIIEVRQDLIATEATAAAWAERLARVLDGLADDEALREPRLSGSRSGPVTPYAG